MCPSHNMIKFLYGEEEMQLPVGSNSTMCILKHADARWQTLLQTPFALKKKVL